MSDARTPSFARKKTIHQLSRSRRRLEKRAESLVLERSDLVRTLEDGLRALGRRAEERELVVLLVVLRHLAENRRALAVGDRLKPRKGQ